MKKALSVNLLTLLFIAMFSTAVRASSVESMKALAEIDTSKAADGLIIYKYSGDAVNDNIIAIIQKEGAGNTFYPFLSDTVVLPLSSGTGTYTLNVAQRMDDGRAIGIIGTTVTVTSIDETKMYLASNGEVDYAASNVAIPAYEEMTGALEGMDKIQGVYEDLVMNYVYDHDREAAVLNGTLKSYHPVIDDVYGAKAGICYDYSAVLAGALRSQGIPVKLVKGYASTVNTLHAWNEILIDGEWVIVDATVDAAYETGGAEYEFAKSSEDYQADKSF